MIWPFSILFDPIQNEIIESYPLKNPPDWKALSPLLADEFSIAGNMLPSKNIGSPVGKIFLGTAQVKEQGALDNSKVLKTLSDVRLMFVPGSKYREEHYAELFDSGCEFTMNYKNMFMVVPTVVMYEKNDEIVVKYFYKQGVKSLQYYWFGFCSIFLSAIVIFTLIFPIFGFLFFEHDIIMTVDGELRSNDFFSYFGSVAFMLCFPFLLGGMALYFRKDLLSKARVKVREFLDVI